MHPQISESCKTSSVSLLKEKWLGSATSCNKVIFYSLVSDVCLGRFSGRIPQFASPLPLPSPHTDWLQHCGPALLALQVSGCADYPQVLDTRQIWALSSVSVGCPSKPCYRIGARQLAQLAFGKLPRASHGTSFALMVPDKLADQSCLPSQGARVDFWMGWTRKRRYISQICT